MKRPSILLALVVLAALALYLATPQSHFFSDGPHMLGLAQTSPVPHYNVLYVPTGYAFHAVLHDVFGMTSRRALEVHTACMVALGILFTGLALRRLTNSGTTLVLVLALLAVTPAEWFFATTIEVHGVQFAAASFAFWAALEARRSRRPLLWVASAWLVSVLGHLTCVILAPCLLLFAITGECERGLTWRGVGWTALVGVAVIALADLGVFLWTHLLQHERGAIGPGLMLWSFAVEYVAQLERRGLFLGDELLEYLDHEFWRPAFLLLAGLPLTFLAAWRRARWLLVPTLLGTLAYLAVFTQGGVWERGAYYVSLHPAYAALLVVGWDASCERRRLPRGVLCGLGIALIVGQAAMSLRDRGEFNVGLRAEDWASRVLAVVPEGSLIYTDELPRGFCLDVPDRELFVHVIRKELDRWPEAKQVAMGRILLEGAIGVLIDGRDVYLDAEIFDQARDRRRSVRSFARAVDEELAKTGVLRREPVHDATGQLILYRVRMPSQG